jgi:hypothetical protein
MRYKWTPDAWIVTDKTNPFIIELELNGRVRTLSNPRYSLEQDNPVRYFQEGPNWHPAKLKSHSIEYSMPIWKREYTIERWTGEFDPETGTNIMVPESFTDYFNPVTQRWDTTNETVICNEIFEWGMK